MNPSFDPEKPISRRNFPLKTGETVTLEGERARFIDYPTGGPEFKLLDEDDPAFETAQPSTKDFAAMWKRGVVKTKIDREVDELKRCVTGSKQWFTQLKEVEDSAMAGEWHVIPTDIIELARWAEQINMCGGDIDMQVVVGGLANLIRAYEKEDESTVLNIIRKLEKAF